MGERIGVDIVNTLYDSAELIVSNYQNAGDFDGFKLDLMTVFAIDAPVDAEQFRSMKAEKLVDAVADAAFMAFKRKMDRLAEVANPVIRQVYENQGAQYEKILIPITDGKRVYNIPVNLKEAYESESKEVIKAFEKSILLYTIDEGWKENLRELDELRHSVQNATYEQKDPLLIYKLESYNLFKKMVEDINRKIAAILMRAQIPVPDPDQVRRAEEQRRQDMSRYQAQKQELGASGQRQAAERDTRERQVTQPIHVEKTVGRNDPCPCGSGKKYKNCHGREAN